MEDGAPPHRCLAGVGGSPRHVGGPSRELSRAGLCSSVGPPYCPYSPKCVEGEFCELRHHGVLGSSPCLACVSRLHTIVKILRMSDAPKHPLWCNVMGTIANRGRRG